VSKLTELADEGNHIHVASTSRWRLQRICRVAENHFHLTVHEFPHKGSSDCLDPVHTTGSWHYRKAGDPWTARAYDAKTRCTLKNLAMDASGSRQREFFNWVLHKYGRPSGWFQS
jgi:hypothetical protein